MNDEPDDIPIITKSAKAAKAAKAPAAVTLTPPADTRVAKILITAPRVAAKGFTFAKGATVPGVPLAHAEYLQGRGEVKILEVL
jgi:hypothetical protein